MIELFTPKAGPVRAFQYQGLFPLDILRVGDYLHKRGADVVIVTPARNLHIAKGDWVVRRDDELWTCGAQFFAETYQPAGR